MFRRIVAIAIVYFIAVAGWMLLGSTLVIRTNNQDNELKKEVGQLWGSPLEQKAPRATLAVERPHTEKPAAPVDTAKPGEVNGKPVEQPVVDKFDVPIIQNDISVNLALDQRQKGLLWYSTYAVRFSGSYVFENIHSKAGEMTITFALPAANGLYDEFKFEVDGKPMPVNLQSAHTLVAKIDCQPNTRHSLAINYYSHGMDRFIYRFGDGISEVRDFNLLATTDFGGYDHSSNTLSPTAKQKAGDGWQLTWNYKDLISGNGIGIEMPQKINPGPMAARISFFAPVSLGFFFFLIFIISLLKGVEIHPMNYFFIAASFFAFHLLLAYLVDHISIHSAFALCSIVSIILVVSYMRIVVGNRFAFLEAALAQTVYLIGFSYAFFIEGFTGLAVTIGAIVTLFIVMQMTARINWSEKFKLNSASSRGEALELE